MKISIITVCLNSRTTLEQTIKSVVNQEYAEKEYIVIDGGSTDGTVELIKKYSNQISFWASEPDRGIYDAMNKGLERATGEVIAFLNSDDWYEPHTLVRVADYFSANCMDCLGGEVNSVIRNRVLNRKRSHTKEDIHFYMIYNHPALFVKKIVFDEIGMFDIRYKISADYDFVLRAHNAGYVFLEVPDVFTNFRREGLSENQRCLAVKEGLEISLKNLGEHGDELKEQILQRVNPDKEYDNTIMQMVYMYDPLFIKNFLNDGKNIYIWGAGKTGNRYLALLLKAGIEIIGVIDTYNTQKKFQGYPVIRPQDVPRDAFVCIASINYYEEIIGKLREMEFEKDRYLTLFDFKKRIIEYGKKFYADKVL